MGIFEQLRKNVLSILYNYRLNVNSRGAINQIKHVFRKHYYYYYCFKTSPSFR